MTTSSYVYYPGCALQHRSHAYEVSNQAVAKALGIELVELDDWNCCGATEYFSVKRLPAYALVARNLALAAQAGTEELVVPCSACFLNLHKTDSHMRQHPRLEQAVNEALEAGDLHYKPGSVRVRHLVEVIINDIGFERLGQLVRRPLYGLKLAAYYGCLIVRPDNVLDDVEQPMLLDRMIEALGAEAAPFSMKTACCGGHMTQISETTALEMIHRLVTNASVSEADAMVTICPMCQLNLDVYQDAANRMFETSYTMPVLFFTQVIGLALGLSLEALGFGQEFVSVEPLIEKIRDVPPARSKPERRPKQALPMPAMPQ